MNDMCVCVCVLIKVTSSTTTGSPPLTVRVAVMVNSLSSGVDPAGQQLHVIDENEIKRLWMYHDAAQLTGWYAPITFIRTSVRCC